MRWTLPRRRRTAHARRERRLAAAGPRRYVHLWRGARGWARCCRVGTKRAPISGSIGDMRTEGPPTARQAYALAAALCEKTGESFPETLAEASTQLERLRTELGHPAPHLADCPPPRRRSFRRGRDLLASEVAAHLARELQ